MEVDSGVCTVRFTDRIEEAGLRIQPGDFVLILVAQQFEVHPRDGARETVATAGLPGTAHQSQVAVGKSLVLVIDQEFGAAVDDLVQCLCNRLFAGNQITNEPRIRGCDSSPAEGLSILLDRNAVEFDGPHQRSVRDRNEASLPRCAEHHDVGEDRVAEDLSCECICIERLDIIFTDDAADGRNALVDSQAGVAVLDKIRCRHLRGIEQYSCAAAPEP